MDDKTNNVLIKAKDCNSQTVTECGLQSFLAFLYKEIPPKNRNFGGFNLYYGYNQCAAVCDGVAGYSVLFFYKVDCCVIFSCNIPHRFTVVGEIYDH